MGHANIWYSHPRRYGQGSRSWYVRHNYNKSITIWMFGYNTCLTRVSFLPFQPSLLQPTRSNSQIWTEHLQTVLQGIRTRYWIQKGKQQTIITIPTEYLISLRHCNSLEVAQFYILKSTETSKFLDLYNFILSLI